MKFLVPMFMMVLVAQLASALVRAESVSRNTAEFDEPAVQYSEMGYEYKHGAWCIDGRVF
jgi:hypothetical protein